MAATALRIVPLEIGRLDSDLSELTGASGRALLPVPSWLIEHPRGVVLFDAGMHRSMQQDTSRLQTIMASTIVDFPVGEELASRLSQAGYGASDIDVLVLSHLHFDHAGGTVEVPNARLIVQEPEWRAAHHPKLVEIGLYAPSDFEVGHDRQLINGEHDVFGDGTVVCIPTLGHTRGHQALRVRLPHRSVVLTGDCVYFESMLSAMQVPVFAYDRDQQLASMRRLVELRDAGCELLFGHDVAQFRSLPSAIT
jgi:N-acyl homoserine lactone hydrolase